MAFEEIEKLKERLAKDPSSKLFVPLAEEYRKAGMFDEAIEVLKNGLESQPSYMSARVSLGKIYLEKDMIDEAKAEFEQVTKAIPDNLFAHKKLAEIYKELGDPIKAIQRYELVLKLNPLDEDAKINLESLSGSPAADENEGAENDARPSMAPEPPTGQPEPVTNESEAAPAPPDPVSPETEAFKSAPVRPEPETAPKPAPAPSLYKPLEPEPVPAPDIPKHLEPKPISIEPDSVSIEPEPVSVDLGSVSELSEQTPVEMSSRGDESGSKLEDMLMHEEIKAEAADVGGDFQQFRRSFSSDLREKGAAPEKTKDDTPMYYMGDEPGSPQSEERGVSNEIHPFARFAENKGLETDDDMSTQNLSEQTLADIPIIEDGEEIPEVSLSENEIEEIETGYPGEIESGFNTVEEEDEDVPEITLSESDLAEAAFPDMSENFSLPDDNETAVTSEDIPAIPDIPYEPVTSFTSAECPMVPDFSEEKAADVPKPAPAPKETATPGGEPDILKGLKNAEIYIDAGDFVQAVHYYDMLLEKFPGERRILQKLEELKTYLKMTGKGQEMVVQKMEILLKGIQKRKNEFFRSA